MTVKFTEVEDFLELIFSDEYTLDEVHWVLGKVSDAERKANKNSFRRLVDLTQAVPSNMNFETMFQIKEAREAKVMNVKSKTAIIVNTDVQFGTARMWQSMGPHGGALVEIFRDKDLAIEWLCTPI